MLAIQSGLTHSCTTFYLLTAQVSGLTAIRRTVAPFAGVQFSFLSLYGVSGVSIVVTNRIQVYVLLLSGKETSHITIIENNIHDFL